MILNFIEKFGKNLQRAIIGCVSIKEKICRCYPLGIMHAPRICCCEYAHKMGFIFSTNESIFFIELSILSKFLFPLTLFLTSYLEQPINAMQFV